MPTRIRAISSSPKTAGFASMISESSGFSIGACDASSPPLPRPSFVRTPIGSSRPRLISEFWAENWTGASFVAA
ncbi:hypothetical protein D9M72_542030 [compost metagenome]